MKLLFITPFNPFPPFWGGGTRTYSFLKYLAKKNELDVVYPSYRQFEHHSGTVYRRKLQEKGTELHSIGPSSSIVQYINPLLAHKALRLAFKKEKELVICDYPWSGIYSLLLKQMAKIPFVLMEHNVEYLVTKQTGYENPALTRLLERKTSKEAERVFCVSKKDKTRLKLTLGVEEEKIDILRNGYDAERFQPDDRAGIELREELGIGDKPLVLFYGKMDYLPNKEAVDIIREDIAPRVLAERPETKFLIVGGGYEFESEQDLAGSMIYTGVVEEIENYVNAADVVITPIQKGGGTRIKIIESVACNKDIVSTTKGIENLIDEHTTKFVEIADEKDRFAQKVLALIGRPDPKVSKEFENKYAWRNIFDGIERKLKSLIT